MRFGFYRLAALLNRPSRVKVRYKRLIQLQDFGRWGYGIHCVVDRGFDVRAGLIGDVCSRRTTLGYLRESPNPETSSFNSVSVE